jgi:hypothetical protein
MPLSILDAIVGVGQAADFVYNTVGAFRFLLSPSFRARTRERWRSERRAVIENEIAYGVFGVLVTVGVVVLIFI